MNLKIAAGIVAASIAGLAYASYICPIDKSTMYFTGTTRVDMGKLLKQYRCPQGHTTWVVD